MRTVFLLLTGLGVLIVAWFMLIVTLALLGMVGVWEVALALIVSLVLSALTVTAVSYQMDMRIVQSLNRSNDMDNLSE